MDIDQQLLTEIARKATDSSSRALSVLADKEVTVKTTQVTSLQLDKLTDMISGKPGLQIVAFSQLISGINGAALLIMEHDDTLRLVDTLMKNPEGTTKILSNIDRSAIKETLNILSNSQLTTLAKDLGITINVMPPGMISREQIAQVLDYLASHQGESTELIVFETALAITGQEIQITMLIAFGSELAAIIDHKEDAS